jgi:hypothetical protein
MGNNEEKATNREAGVIKICRKIAYRGANEEKAIISV